MTSRRPPAPRDQDATPFSSILSELCGASGARCAALVDAEGETVDYGGQGEPFDIRILAAEWRLVLQHMASGKFLGTSQEFTVRARKKSFLIEVLPEGYALVIELARRATGASNRALCEARRCLCEEAGFDDNDRRRGAWRKVSVSEEPGRRHRPRTVNLEDGAVDVSVMGRMTTEETSAREFSYRVRLATGEECTLVREPFGHWYLESDHWD